MSTPWHEVAARLVPGGHRDIPHDECGSGPKLRVSKALDGKLSCYCFRCHWSDWRAAPVESLAERQARLALMAKGDDSIRGIELPRPAVYDVHQWPGGARLWLLKAGLWGDRIDKLGAYYHPPSDRVVLPLYVAGKLAFWQARAYQPGRQPKYLNQGGRPNYLLVQFGEGVPTITEDVLSAFKVSLAGGQGWPMLGTAPNAALRLACIRAGTINLWLDPDAAGRRAARVTARSLRAAGVTVRIIQSTRDPKLLHLDEIREHLHGSPSQVPPAT